MVDFRPAALRARFTPPEITEAGDGLRPSVARLLEQIDLDDPDFGRVASVLSDMVKAGIDLDDTTIDIALKLGRGDKPSKQMRELLRSRDFEASMGLPLWGDQGNQHSIVYYIQRGRLVKIGTTTNPESRFNSLLPDEILAFEPGGREIEAFRHQQFSYLRRGRSEHFEPGPALMKHIKRVRAAHGDPDPKWKTTANVPPTLTAKLDRPESAETASAAELSRLLNVKPPTIRMWASRGHLQKVAGSKPNRPLYFVDQARQLANDSGEIVKRSRHAKKQ